eukprot:PhF_6_TR865/c0_g1_i1/m.1303
MSSLSNSQISANGFRTTPALGREARMSLKDRDLREKHNLASRTEGFQRFDVYRNPIQAFPNTPAFTTSTEALRTDISQTLKASERQQKELKKSVVQVKSDKRQLRDDTRQILREAASSKEHREAMALLGTGKRNAGSVGYDLTTGVWKAGAYEADVMRYKDAMVEYSAKTRSMKLFHRSTKVDFDILNGMDKPCAINVPEPPKPVSKEHSVSSIHE